MELVGTFKLTEGFYRFGGSFFQYCEKSVNSFWLGEFFPDEASKDLSFEPTPISFEIKLENSQLAEGGHPD